MLVNLIVGAVVGLLATVLLLTLHFLEMLRTPLGSQLLFLALAFHITGLIAALGYHRHRAKGEGGAPFSRLLGAGLMVSLVAGLVLAFGTYVFVTVVDQGYLDWLKQSSIERLEASVSAEQVSSEQVSSEPRAAEPASPDQASPDQEPEISQEDLARHRRQIEELTPLTYALQTLTSTLIAGFFLSLTLAAFLRMRVLRSGAGS